MKNKAKKCIKIIQLEAFPYDIMVATCVSKDLVLKKLKKYGQVLDEHKKDFLMNTAIACTVKLPNNAVLIYFDEIPTQGIIAHEAFHAVWMILDHMGVDPHVSSEEVYAYLIEYVVNKI